MSHLLSFFKMTFGWDTNLPHSGEYSSPIRNRLTSFITIDI